MENKPKNKIKDFILGAGAVAVLAGGVTGCDTTENSIINQKNKLEKTTLDRETEILFNKSLEHYTHTFKNTRPESNLDLIEKICEERLSSMYKRFPIILDSKPRSDSMWYLAKTVRATAEHHPDTLVLGKGGVGYQETLDLTKNSAEEFIDNRYGFTSENTRSFFGLLVSEMAHLAFGEISKNHYEKIKGENTLYTDQEMYTQPEFQEYITHEVIEHALHAYLFQPIEENQTLDSLVAKAMQSYEYIHVKASRQFTESKKMTKNTFTTQTLKAWLSLDNMLYGDINNMKNIINAMISESNTYPYTPSPYLLYSIGDSENSETILAEDLVHLDQIIQQLVSTEEGVHKAIAINDLANLPMSIPIITFIRKALVQYGMGNPEDALAKIQKNVLKVKDSQEKDRILNLLQASLN